MTAPGAPALSEGRCWRSLPFLLVWNQRIRYFGTQGGPSSRKSEPQAPRAPRVLVVPPQPAWGPERAGEEGRRLLAGAQWGETEGEGIGGWRRAQAPRPASIPFGSLEGKPPPLPLLFLPPLCLLGALGSRGFSKAQSPRLLLAAQRAQGPASSALGPASPRVFPEGNGGAQRLASLPALRRRSRGAV